MQQRHPSPLRDPYASDHHASAHAARFSWFNEVSTAQLAARFLRAAPHTGCSFSAADHWDPGDCRGCRVCAQRGARGDPSRNPRAHEGCLSEGPCRRPFLVRLKHPPPPPSSQVVSLKEAHVSRVAKLQEQLAVALLPKRARLGALGAELRRRVAEVVAARVAVERETVADCEAVLERLRLSESAKLATLTSNLRDVNAELDAIDRLAQQLEGRSADGLELIQSYPDLVRALERLAARALPNVGLAETESALGAFPRETKKRADALAKEAKYEEALLVKDRLVWELAQGRKKAEGQLADEKVRRQW